MADRHSERVSKAKAESDRDGHVPPGFVPRMAGTNPAKPLVKKGLLARAHSPRKSFPTALVGFGWDVTRSVVRLQFRGNLAGTATAVVLTSRIGRVNFDQTDPRKKSGAVARIGHEACTSLSLWNRESCQLIDTSEPYPFTPRVAGSGRHSTRPLERILDPVAALG